MERPRSGEFYRHFKGNLYQIIGIAKHSETEEEMVVYQALYGTFGLYVRPLSSFLEELRPEASSKWGQTRRFQKISVSQEKNDVGGNWEAAGRSEEKKGPLMAFLEAKTWQEKLEVLLDRKEELTEDILYACGEAADIVLRPSSGREELFYELTGVLRAKERYEKKRR